MWGFAEPGSSLGGAPMVTLGECGDPIGRTSGSLPACLPQSRALQQGTEGRGQQGLDPSCSGHPPSQFPGSIHEELLASCHVMGPR